jgi:hypothetical protein
MQKFLPVAITLVPLALAAGSVYVLCATEVLRHSTIFIP